MLTRRIMMASMLIACLAGCGQSAVHVPSGEETKYLYSLKSGESKGDKVGDIVLNGNVMLLHPGETTPTTITFDLDGKIREMILKPFIATLDEAGKNNPLAGVVGVEFFVDGKSADKFKVDRNFEQEKILDVKGIKKLEIRVDNGNGTPIWDWFHIRVISIK